MSVSTADTGYYQSAEVKSTAATIRPYDGIPSQPTPSDCTRNPTTNHHTTVVCCLRVHIPNLNSQVVFHEDPANSCLSAGCMMVLSGYCGTGGIGVPVPVFVLPYRIPADGAQNHPFLLARFQPLKEPRRESNRSNPVRLGF